MFTTRYFPQRYFPQRYFGAGPVAAIPIEYELLIEGEEKEPLYGWEISSIINGQSSFRFNILSDSGAPIPLSSRRYFANRFFSAHYFGSPFFSARGSILPFRPEEDDEVLLYEGPDLIFGGMIILPIERGVLDEGAAPINTSVNCLDFKVLTQRRFVNETLPGGTTLKAALTALLAYLPDVTIDAFQVDGPVLNERIFLDEKVEDVLNEWTTLTGYIWKISFANELSMKLPGAELAPYDITTTNDVVMGDISVEKMRDKYANRVIARTTTLRSVANDFAEQALRPVWEVVITAPDTTDQIGLDALATAYLLRSVVVPRKIRYKTLYRGFAPGQTQNVVSVIRNLNNNFLITDVRTNRQDGQTVRDITAIEGDTYQTDWRDVYRQWSGGGVTVGGGSVGGGAVVQRFAYPLAMNGTEAVQSPTPTWVPASGGGAPGAGSVHVQVDTVQRGTTVATIKARMRVLDAGNSVQARLWDVSASAPVAGVSTVVTSTTWQTVSWNVTLNSGAHEYELQLLPGLADSDVAATAYLE